MKKIVTVVCLIMIIATSFALAACESTTQNAENYNTINVVSPDGAPSVALAKMMKNNVVFNNTVGNYTITKGANLPTEFASGKADVIIAPTNLGVKLAAQNGYKIAAVTSWGNLYIIGDATVVKPRSECADAKEFLEQFAGKTVHSIEAKAVPGETFSYLLKAYNVELESLTPSDDQTISTKLKSNEISLGILGEPAVSACLKNAPSVSRLASISELWKEVTGQDFPQASVFIKDTLDSALAEAFLLQLASSIFYLNASSANARELGDYLASRGDTNLNGDKVSNGYLGMAQKYVSAVDASDDILKFLEVMNVPFDKEKLEDITFYCRIRS